MDEISLRSRMSEGQSGSNKELNSGYAILQLLKYNCKMGILALVGIKFLD
jgi:hypothetical protein